MNQCEYCGKQNDEAAETCSECGSPLASVSVVAQVQSADQPDDGSVPPVLLPPSLNAGRATLILLFTFLAQVAGAAVVTAVFIFIQGIRGADLQAADQIRELTSRIQPAAFLCSATCGVLVMLGSALLLVRRDLKERTPLGAAWVLGSKEQVAFSFALGFGAALLFTIISVISARFIRPELGPVSRMGVMRGAPQLVWIFLALVLAPAPEELLFRGILHAGYRRSFGPTAAAVLTTLIFVAMHVTEWSRFLPALLGITGLACLTLWLRLRTQAIGPAIAAHLGYNALIVLYAVGYTLLQPG